MKLLNKTNQKGFTIIEVTIVLAIAAVIMVIVFTAVPALQRSSRNTQRRNDASHLSNLINEYLANNGSLPTAVDSATQPNPPAAGTLYLGGEKFNQLTVTPANPTSTIASPLPTATNQAVIYTSAKCNGNTPVASTNTNSAVVFYNVESAGAAQPQCIATNG